MFNVERIVEKDKEKEKKERKQYMSMKLIKNLTMQQSVWCEKL
jgi:hypothetical protein